MALQVYFLNEAKKFTRKWFHCQTSLSSDKVNYVFMKTERFQMLSEEKRKKLKEKKSFFRIGCLPVAIKTADCGLNCRQTTLKMHFSRLPAEKVIGRPCCYCNWQEKLVWKKLYEIKIQGIVKLSRLRELPSLTQWKLDSGIIEVFKNVFMYV